MVPSSGSGVLKSRHIVCTDIWLELVAVYQAEKKGCIGQYNTH